MGSEKQAAGVLDDVKIPVRLKLSSLWVSVMLCYIYGDYFELYVPGKLQEMLAGRIGPLGPATQGVLLGTAIMMAVPSVMVFLCMVLRPNVNRLANIALGAVYTLIMVVVATASPWTFYRFLAFVEIALTLLVVWYAWTWPKREDGQS